MVRSTSKGDPPTLKKGENISHVILFKQKCSYQVLITRLLTRPLGNRDLLMLQLAGSDGSAKVSFGKFFKNVIEGEKKYSPPLRVTN